MLSVRVKMAPCLQLGTLRKYLEETGGKESGAELRKVSSGSITCLDEDTRYIILTLLLYDIERIQKRVIYMQIARWSHKPPPVFPK
jgi:hypothetical protein